MSEIKPNFDRDGRAIGWGGWLFGLLGFKSMAAVVGK
jgi:beta-apo-4'-carotenal oxygenase